ncbi:hypothetical protein Tco_1091808 [Tanacetum coccineum]|uniref:Uncharacterized protein n=1 Tax=Tanacetum coccineum TaxID=301880 RepID=A0ABQ5I840_9ASTR
MRAEYQVKKTVSTPSTTLQCSLFNTEFGDASINLNVDARDDDDDDAQEVKRRPMGRDKATNLKKKGVGSSGTSSTLNEGAFAMLVVSELAMHNERAMEMKKQ